MVPRSEFNSGRPFSNPIVCNGRILSVIDVRSTFFNELFWILTLHCNGENFCCCPTFVLKFSLTFEHCARPLRKNKTVERQAMKFIRKTGRCVTVPQRKDDFCFCGFAENFCSTSFHKFIKTLHQFRCQIVLPVFICLMNVRDQTRQAFSTRFARLPDTSERQRFQNSMSSMYDVAILCCC